MKADVEHPKRKWTTAGVDLSSISGDPIQLRDVGVEFAINRRKKTRVRDLFLHGRRRASSERFWALKDFSLTVRAGEAVGIVGSNGSGKSTLLKLIAGVLRPDEGSVEISGAIAPLIELGAGFDPELSARDNVYLNGTILGLSKEEIDDRYEMIVTFAGVRRFMDTPLKHFSSGMKVRLGFGIVTQLSHPLLLIDEVLAVGDKRFRRRCYRAMEEMMAQGRTLVLVSHRDRDIERFCQRAVYLKDGRMAMEGPVDQVLETYTADSETE